jgi:hypothetical protein
MALGQEGLTGTCVDATVQGEGTKLGDIPNGATSARVGCDRTCLLH